VAELRGALAHPQRPDEATPEPGCRCGLYVGVCPKHDQRYRSEVIAVLREQQHTNEVPTDDYREKYYVKARVYGAIACRFREALERLSRLAFGNSQHVAEIAREALEWCHSERGGVPRRAIDEIDELLQADAQRTETAGPDAWKDKSDKPLPEDDAIHAAFPTRSGRHDLYAEAMRLVGARYSKGGLVALVNWLLHRASRHQASELLKEARRRIRAVPIKDEHAYALGLAIGVLYQMRDELDASETGGTER
jgi:hypothetical protein